MRRPPSGPARTSLNAARYRDLVYAPEFTRQEGSSHATCPEGHFLLGPIVDNPCLAPTPEWDCLRRSRAPGKAVWPVWWIQWGISESYLPPSIEGFLTWYPHWDTLYALAKEHLTGRLPIYGTCRRAALHKAGRGIGP